MANRRAMLAQISLFAILAMIIVALAVLSTKNYFKEAYAKQNIFERGINSEIFRVWKNQTIDYAKIKFRIYECSHQFCKGTAIGSDPAWNISRCLNENCNNFCDCYYYNKSGKPYANFSINYAEESVYLNIECLNSSRWDECFGKG